MHGRSETYDTIGQAVSLDIRPPFAIRAFRTHKDGRDLGSSPGQSISTEREQAAGRASATRLTEGAEKAYFALTERKDDACHHLLEVTRVLNDLPGTNAF